jgi:hypothetical protein
MHGSYWIWTSLVANMVLMHKGISFTYIIIYQFCVWFKLSFIQFCLH